VRVGVIEVGAIPEKELRGNSRAHPLTKHRLGRKWRESGRDHKNFELGVGWWEVPKVRITFEFHHSRKIDHDNLAIGMKPFVDGLVDGGLVVDDGPDHVVYGQHTFVKDSESKVIVTIQEVLT
jgi:hypothetical protein